MISQIYAHSIHYPLVLSPSHSLLRLASAYLFTYASAELLTKPLLCDISQEKAEDGERESAALTSSLELWALSYVPVG